MDRLLYLNHSPIDFYFSKNVNDFVVAEIPLYEFSGDGEHLILKIRKKNLTTWEMLQAFSEATGVKKRDFGYAGLKDKDGMTVQYISMPKSFEEKLNSFEHEKIKILEKTYHKNKLRIGHLKGNRFFIRLKKVNPVNALKLKEALKAIDKQGFPNYYGYQRFGKEQNNFIRGKEILEGKIRERNKKMRNFFISAYQSHLFNLWLSQRVKISRMFNSFNVGELSELFDFTKEIIKQIKNQKNFCKLLPGDILHHYPHGKTFMCDDITEESKRFENRDITLTGILPGAKTPKADGIASIYEKDFLKETESFLEKMNGSRRFAWIWAEDVEYNYKEEEAWFEFHFSLPKGSYATVLLEELTHHKM